jgi:hypothetical protein
MADGFLDRDLYVFCFNIGDAKAIANASTNPAAKKTIGMDVRTLKDSTGKVFGKDLYDAAAKEGQIIEIMLFTATLCYTVIWYAAGAYSPIAERRPQ